MVKASKAKTEEVELVVEDKVKAEPKKKKKLDRNELILVMNNTSGTLTHTSRKTGQEWLFHEYGQTDEIELAELISINNSSPKMLREPWLLILDDDAVEYLGLKKLYENIMDEDEMHDFFNASYEKMEEVIDKMPKGMQELIIGLAQNKVKDHTLSDTNKIRLLEKKFKVKLLELLED